MTLKPNTLSLAMCNKILTAADANVPYKRMKMTDSAAVLNARLSVKNTISESLDENSTTSTEVYSLANIAHI